MLPAALRWGIAGAAALAFSIGFPLSGNAAGPTACDVPDEVAQPNEVSLPVVAARIRARAPLRVVAIGGASTAGIVVIARRDQVGVGAEDAWPRRFERALSEKLSGVSITVANKGVAREATKQMLARFAKDVVPDAPHLVIWETGTIDAVRGMDVEAFGRHLQDGIDALRRINADILLIDMQYARSTSSIINYQPYLAVLHRVADRNNVGVFRRYDTMKYWSEHDVFNFDSVPPNDRPAIVAQVYDCIGRALAKTVKRAAR